MLSSRLPTELIARLLLALMLVCNLTLCVSWLGLFGAGLATASIGVDATDHSSMQMSSCHNMTMSTPDDGAPQNATSQACPGQDGLASPGGAGLSQLVTLLTLLVLPLLLLPLPGAARAAGFCLIPVWVTGGIHLDGYADTCDALSSYGDREKKLEILKDPHCGAFAVIRLCSYFAAYLMLCACVQFTPRTGALWTLALMGERMLSGLAVAAFPLAKNTGLAHTFATAADRRTVCRVLAAGCLLWAVGILALGGWALLLAAGLVFARYHRVAVRQFGGTTGDLAGWFLQKCEIWMLAALAACWRVPNV